MPKKIQKPKIRVDRTGKHAYRLMFSVGVQGFQIAYVDGRSSAREECMIVRDMFTACLETLHNPQVKREVLLEDCGCGYYRTVFRVGQSYWELASASALDDPHAVAHCEFIQKCFIQALNNMGVQCEPTTKLAQS